MMPELEKTSKILIRYKQLYEQHYGGSWKPSDEHIYGTINLFKSSLAGFEPYNLQDILQRLEIFFQQKDDWIVVTRHNYNVFLKHIHRWVPKRTIEKQKVDIDCYQCDCGKMVKIGEQCEDCFPVCPKCGQRHWKEESCDEIAMRMKNLKAILRNE